ncbi:MAG TPA: sigma-54 dependent transcriptional regulator [Gemmatimonadaceae bacterium]|nr:sigma-54 dependent transcriptional regulator [Gemmatimonadaceae bacterium]
MTRILIVDDDRAFRLSTAALLRADGYEVDGVADGAAAAEALRETRPDLVVLDLRMPGVDGLGVVEALRMWGERVPILMISGFGTVDTAVRALHLGADDFLTKPVEPDVLSARVADLLARRPLLEGAAPNPAGMVGRSPKMREALAAIARVAVGDTTVLVTGETGTGKELAARAVHDLSPRKHAPFIAVNCGALAEGILESELFGHVRGAFTGAVRDRVGVFEAADGGTIFLDEIGEMSVTLQQRLLRVLQEREVTRVGASRPAKVNVRVVAATNRDLASLVEQGRFREDLYYRLAVFPIALPPLRDRRADIPLLVEHALSILRARREGAEHLACSPLAMRLLRAYDWPGNVRHLFGVLERAAVEAGYGRIEAQHLPAELRPASNGAPELREQRYRGTVPADEERAAIVSALEQTGGALAQSAELLGMGRTTLWRKLKLYGLTPTVTDEPDLG